MKLKQLVSFIHLFFITSVILAQVPSAFNYQAVIRDSNGDLVSNRDISFGIKIIKGNPEGETSYSEIHNITTSERGLISLRVGMGTPELGSINEIPWENGVFYIETSMDLNNGTDLEVISTSQLLSVPFALYAQSAGNDLWKHNENGAYFNGGNIGIGTNDPFSPLSVVLDTTEIGTSNFTSLADFQRTVNGSTARFLIYGYPDSDKVLPHVRKSAMLYATSDAKDLLITATQDNGRIRFFTQTWTDADNERMVIDSQGNIGIGIKSPSRKLSVAGTIQSTFGGIEFPDGSVQSTAFTGSNWTANGDTLSFNKGNIGIGITSPQQKLSVAGTIQSTSGGFKFPDGTTQSTASTGSNWTANGDTLSFSKGNIGIGITSPQQKLAVAGTIQSTTGGFKFPDGTTQSTAFTGSNWIANGDTLSFNRGNIGIGITSPRQKLAVAGTIQSTTGGFKFPDGTTQSTAFTGFNWTANGDTLSFNKGNIGIGITSPQQKLAVAGIIQSTTGGFKFPDGSVQSTADKGSNWIKNNKGINYSSGSIGIGTNDPFSPLSVVLDTALIGSSTLTSLADFQRTVNGSTARFLIYGYPDSDQVLPHVRKSAMLYATSDAKDLLITATQNEGRIRFFTQTWTNANNERMVIDSQGNVGIGTKNPNSRLQVKSGDIYLEDIGAGVIMKSPDGNCWKMTVDNSGGISTVSATCPGN